MKNWEEYKLLKINHLTKSYRRKYILEDINITIPIGVSCLLGSNGVGKSTLLKILSLNEKFDSGEIFFNERPLFTISNEIGYLSQNFKGLKNLSVIENLEYVSLLKGLSYQNEEFLEYMRLVNLEKYSTTKVKNLSYGMVKRLGIATALIGNPSFVLLDEPTAGLDQAEILRIRNIIRKLGQNKVVIFSTHLLKDVDSIADTFTIIKDGKIIYSKNKGVLSQISCKIEETLINKENLDLFLSNNTVISFKMMDKENYKVRYIREGEDGSSSLTDAKNMEDYYPLLMSEKYENC